MTSLFVLYLPGKRYPLTLALVALFFAQVPRAEAATAALAMPDVYAARVSRQIMEEGGNVVDAAIAVAFSLAVTFPEAGNIGGGGFMVVHSDGESAFLDFREKAPLRATREMYQDAAGEVIDGRSLVGGLAVGVPGTVRGLVKAHQRFGSLPWRELLTPAVRLARDGFLVDAKLGAMQVEALEHFSGRANFADYFGGMKTGATFRQPDLAVTLKRIADDPNDFYTGKIARQIVNQMAASGGLITARDLEGYTARWRDPLVFPWRGHQVVSTPPPSSGGIALTQLLTMHDAASDRFAGLAHNSPRYLHLLAEIEKRVYADRGDYLGDPDFGYVPVAELTDPAYLRKRASEINPEGISAEVAPGLSVQTGGTVSAGAPGMESPDTTHFSIMDSEGNAVALTYTQNWEFGSGVVVSGAGFLLNNQMDDFSAKAGVPNAFGVVGKDMNTIQPGKRMLSSMTPTIVLRDGEPAVVVGSPGGSTIFTSVFQVLLNLFDFDMDAQSAVAATRFHHQLPAATTIRYDAGRNIEPALRQRLETMGYTLEPNWWGTIGDVQLVLVSETGELEAAADPRGRGKAVVFELPDR
jgi:gamma-glutamyltranspeptidase/glutathione hydrolase